MAKAKANGMSEVKTILPSSIRIQTLFDGISAIAMTLLVLNIQLPDTTEKMDNSALLDLLSSMTPRFYIFILSFLLLASLWKVHHRQYSWIKRIDINLLWINILWLLFIALVPFSSSLIGENGHTTAGAFIFHSNLLLVGLISWLSWYYALKKKTLLDASTTNEEIKFNLYLVLILPFTAMSALVACFWIPAWSSYLYFLVIPLRPVLFLIINKTSSIK